MIALVGTDGTRLVVWGIGVDRDDATRDAFALCDDVLTLEEIDTMTGYEISEAQARIVRLGDVSWPIEVTR